MVAREIASIIGLGIVSYIVYRWSRADNIIIKGNTPELAKAVNLIYQAICCAKSKRDNDKKLTRLFTTWRTTRQ